MGKINNRIEKYSKLRERIDQEISILQIKKENSDKISRFQAKVDKIDDQIFTLANERTARFFEDFSNLIDVEQAKEASNLDKFKEDLHAAETKLEEKLQSRGEGKKPISDFVPEFGNEDLIKKQINAIQNNRDQIEINYKTMLGQKTRIEEKAAQVESDFVEEKNVFQGIVTTQKKIEARENSIEYWKNLRKGKTKWLFWALFVLLFAVVLCLFLLIAVR